jgi:hypothetical protein
VIVPKKGRADAWAIEGHSILAAHQQPGKSPARETAPQRSGPGRWANPAFAASQAVWRSASASSNASRLTQRYVYDRRFLSPYLQSRAKATCASPITSLCIPKPHVSRAIRFQQSYRKLSRMIAEGWQQRWPGDHSLRLRTCVEISLRLATLRHRKPSKRTARCVTRKSRPGQSGNVVRPNSDRPHATLRDSRTPAPGSFRLEHRRTALRLGPSK